MTRSPLPIAPAPGEGAWLDPRLFDPRSVPAATRAVTDRLRRAGETEGVLAVEPRSEEAVERVVDDPGGPLRLRILASGPVRASYERMVRFIDRALEEGSAR